MPGRGIPSRFASSLRVGATPSGNLFRETHAADTTPLWGEANTRVLLPRLSSKGSYMPTNVTFLLGAGLAGASLPDDIYVASSVGATDAGRNPLIAVVGGGEVCDVALGVHGAMVPKTLPATKNQECAAAAARPKLMKKDHPLAGQRESCPAYLLYCTVTKAFTLAR